MDLVPRLFEQRIEQLQTLVTSHFDAGSLDEATPSIIEPMINSWLEEERARLTQAHGRQLAEIEQAVALAEATLAQHEAEVKRTAEARDAAARDLDGARTRLVGVPRLDARSGRGSESTPNDPGPDSAAA